MVSDQHVNCQYWIFHQPRLWRVCRTTVQTKSGLNKDIAYIFPQTVALGFHWCGRENLRSWARHLSPAGGEGGGRDILYLIKWQEIGQRTHLIREEKNPSPSLSAAFVIEMKKKGNKNNLKGSVFPFLSKCLIFPRQCWRYQNKFRTVSFSRPSCRESRQKTERSV